MIYMLNNQSDDLISASWKIDPGNKVVKGTQSRIPTFQYGVLSDSPPHMSQYKSGGGGGRGKRNLGLNL